MATFYKYAERSAESQVNWAEIGKDMTDMLRQEVAVREEKKAAIDEATRKYAEELSNAPQGEHEPGSTEALRFADQATKYMLQQEKLLKSGLLNPRDYMIARQNLTDGTKQAFNSMKAFQANYAELMERAKTDKSSLLEIQNLEEIQGYGNFRQSGFFIDSPTGRVNVGLKEEQDIDGQKVMGLKKGSTRGMQYIQGGIYGRIDKFKYEDAVVPIVSRLGVEIQETLSPSSLTKLGSIRSDEDMRLRKDIDPVTDKPIFDFYTSIRQAAKASVANPLEIASLLVDTLQYKTTTDPAAAAKDPNLILKVTDPDTGRAEYKISDVAQKAGEDFLVQQILSGVTRKSTIDEGGQVSRPRADSPGEDAEQTALEDARNVAQNLVYTLVGNANESSAGTKFMSGFTGLPFEKTKEGISLTDEEGNVQTFKFKADGKTLADPTAFVKSFIGPIARKTGINQDDVIKEFNKLMPKSSRINEETIASGFDEQASDQTALEKVNAIVTGSFNNTNIPQYIENTKGKDTLAAQFNKFIAPGLPGVEFKTSNFSNSVYAVVNGKESENYSVGDKNKNSQALRNLQKFVMDNYAGGKTAEEQEVAAEVTLNTLPSTGGVMSGF